MEISASRKKRKKKYVINWLKNMRRKRNTKVLYQKRRRRPTRSDKG